MGVGAIPVSVSPSAGVLVFRLLLTLLPVLKAVRSCSGLSKVTRFGCGSGGTGLVGSLQLRACLNGNLYPLVRISYSEECFQVEYSLVKVILLFMEG